MELWDLVKAGIVSTADHGTDTYLATGTYTGAWATMMIVDTPTKVSAYTDDGADSCTIPLGATLPVGSYHGANGKFTSVTVSLAGGISLARV